MVRPPTTRIPVFAVAVICLFAAAADLFSGPPAGAASAAVPGAAIVLPAAPDDAVLPARLTEESRAATAAGSFRLFAFAAAVAACSVLAGVGRRALRLGALGTPPVHARRHAITLRAPPLVLA